MFWEKRAGTGQKSLIHPGLRRRDKSKSNMTLIFYKTHGITHSALVPSTKKTFIIYLYLGLFHKPLIVVLSLSHFVVNIPSNMCEKNFHRQIRAISREITYLNSLALISLSRILCRRRC